MHCLGSVASNGEGSRLAIAFDVDEVLSRWQWCEWYEWYDYECFGVESLELLPIKSAASINFSLG